uniref:Uncharacterized protein n=1 Tax=Anguilla anguilla TaxID=7936 RepID=A0A0E9VGZ8_ANGAN
MTQFCFGFIYPMSKIFISQQRESSKGILF